MADLIGQQLGNYRIVRSIGRGGFADVYLSEHIYLRTQVAIKILQAKVANPDDLESFLKEARTIAHLVHPHIVRVMDFGVHDEIPFLVMDYAPNGTLRQRHPRGSIVPLTAIVSYVKDISAALQYAHDQKLIHRDIKPENMLIGRGNEILLSDFGIALIAQSSRYQHTQDVIGTVTYMAPEQIQGKPRPASDQYSLGIVVYEWLTGEQPFRGSFTELCTQHLYAPVPSLCEKVPTLPPILEQVMSIALAKDPHQRFGSIQAFANALAHACQLEDEKNAPTQLSSNPISTPSLPPTRAALPSPEAAAPPPPYSSSHVPTPSPSPSLPSAALPGASPSQFPASTSSSPKMRVWSVGIRQLVATLIGLPLFAILDYAVVNLASSNSQFSSPLIPSLPSGGFSATFTLYGVLISLVYTLPLFISVEFGPWAGMVVVALGGLIGDYALNHALVLPWYWYVSNAIFGFIAGLALVITRGRYMTAFGIFIAVFMSLVATVISNMISVIGDSIVFHLPMTMTDALGAFFGLTLTNLVYLVLLPVVVLLYHVIARSFQRKSA